MMEGLSKLAALAQIRDAQHRHQPGVQSNQGTDTVMAEYMAQLQPIINLEHDLGAVNITRYLKPMSDFNYPAWKKRTCQNVEQMRRAEAKLNMFWEKLDEKLLGKYGKTLAQYMDNNVPRREIVRTPPWQPSQEQQQQQSREAHKPSPLVVYDFTHHNLPDTIGKISTEPREKSKTKGTADPTRAPSTTTPTTITQDGEPPAQVFRLHHRALKTIKAFYPTTTEDREGRKTLWKDFLHAMYSLGFEIQKRHGSEWYFEPTWQRNAPITIHEPHPSHEMRFEKMRFEANRMARKYGWGNGSFWAE